MTADQRIAVTALLTRFTALSIDVEDDGTVLIDATRPTDSLPYQLVVAPNGDTTVTCRLFPDGDPLDGIEPESDTHAAEDRPESWAR